MNLTELAQRAIELEEGTCFEIAAQHCQQFHNIKHMKWFLSELRDAIKYDPVLRERIISGN